MTFLARIKRWWRVRRAVRRARALGLFDADFYLAAARPSGACPTRRKAFRHYLEVGGFEGLDPAPGFDSAWYLTTYQDVQASGLNPLVHYVLYGRPEGRRAYLGAKAPYLPEPPYRQAVRRLGDQLWAGFAWLARPELEALAEAGDATAAWPLALWSYANGERTEAEHWLRRAKAPGGERQRLLALAKCGVPLQAREIALLATPDRALVATNESEAAEALAPLNEHYRSAGLAPLRCSDEHQPPGLDNLRASGEPRSADRGITVSVVMCAHNAEETLPTALESVLAQSWRELEVIVVDDASTDGTAALVKRYQSADSRVRFLQNTANLGAYGARNRGAREARGDFVTVHDSDDWSHPQKLERQLEPLLENPGTMASVSHWVRLQTPFTVVGAWQLDQGLIERNPSSWLVRREVFDRTGFWDEVKVEADTEFALRLEHHYGRGALASVLPDIPLAFARVGSESLTRQGASHVRTQFYGLRRLYAEAARWWHRASGGAPVMHAGARPFPLPLGSMIGPRPPVRRVWVADFTVQNEELAALLHRLDESVESASGMCLLHWPTRFAWAGNEIADEIFAWAQRYGVHWVHPGLKVDAVEVRLLQPLRWEERPYPMVTLPVLETVLDVKGRPCQPQHSWLDYFRSGGGGA